MEVLVVIALIALVGTLAMVDFGALFESASAPSPHEALRAALDAGRERAYNSGSPVRLVYDAEAGALRLLDAANSTNFPAPGLSGATFALPADEAEGVERPLDSVMFHPSGYTTPAVVELTVGGVKTRYRIEPFSASLAPEEPR